jgi:TPR repeat protein
MIGRVAGGTACPRCQYNVVRNPYHPPHRGTEHETEKVPWWRRVIAWWHSLPPWQRWSLIAAPLAVAIGVIAYGIIPSPDRVCAAVPKQPAQALAAVTTRIKAGINAADATALAQTHLQCGQPDAALLLLRTAFDEGDVTAAHILGRLFDPSGPPDAVGRQPPSAVRAIEWYGRAVKAGDATVRPDLQRLAGWLRAGASKGDNEAAGLADDAEAALKEDR